MTETAFLAAAAQYGIPSVAFVCILLYLLKTIQDEKKQHLESQKQQHADSKERETWMRDQVERLSDIQESVAETLAKVEMRLERLENKIT